MWVEGRWEGPDDSKPALADRHPGCSLRRPDGRGPGSAVPGPYAHRTVRQPTHSIRRHQVHGNIVKQQQIIVGNKRQEEQSQLKTGERCGCGSAGAGLRA